MTDIAFLCPHCNQTIEAPEEMGGQVVACPTCRKHMTVPSPEGEAARATQDDSPENDNVANSDIAFDCPLCGQHLEAPRDLSGVPIDCPSCDRQIQVPDFSSHSTPHPAPPPSPTHAPTSPGGDDAALHERLAGEEMTVELAPGVSLTLCWCPAGSYTRGSPSSEPDRGNNETQHRVTLSKGFWMGKFAVTQAQWEAVMGENPSTFVACGKDAPVENVSWVDCQAFVHRVNNLVPGAGFRLPTEAEWEYACRAGTTTAFHFGNDLDANLANFNGNFPYGNGRKGVYRQTTMPVGSFRPNAWNLYDMHGNVWEWCQDRYGDYPSGPVNDPTGDAFGSCRVFRGGSWFCVAMCSRSANRGSAYPGIRKPGKRARNSSIRGLGLRLARTHTPWNASRLPSVVDDVLHKRRAGEEMTVELAPGVRLTLCWCPPGSYTRGSPASETGRRRDEKQHRVTLSKGFWMGKYEVTQTQWQHIMGSNPSRFTYPGKGAPVDCVSWDKCQDFIQEVNDRIPGGGFRLPTEAEWEYACRAGTTGPYAGSLDDMGWYYSNHDLGSSHPVGMKKPNAWGLYDMHGNVYEWCQDWYGDYPSDAVTDPSAGSDRSGTRVCRGGSWSESAKRCRSAYRSAYLPDSGNTEIGFRLARTHIPSSQGAQECECPRTVPGVQPASPIQSDVDYYMEVNRDVDADGNAKCSDSSCPCGYPGVTLRYGEGYVYVSQEVVDFRKDCPTTDQAIQKVQAMQARGIELRAEQLLPILMCELGARKRNLNLHVAAADARYWWSTGKVPIRPTPLA